MYLMCAVNGLHVKRTGGHVICHGHMVACSPHRWELDRSSLQTELAHLEKDVMEVHNTPGTCATVEGVPIPPHVSPGVKMQVPALLSC